MMATITQHNQTWDKDGNIVSDETVDVEISDEMARKLGLIS